jgi:hypothetical protein
MSVFMVAAYEGDIGETHYMNAALHVCTVRVKDSMKTMNSRHLLFFHVMRE